jgi:P-type conjugative transfer protein TrbJ
MKRLRLIAVVIGSVAGALCIRPAAAQWAVIDGSNLAQNTLTAARALEQINNQVQQLQNQVVMLANEARNLTSLNYSSLGQLNSTIAQISALMDQAQGIAFNVTATQSAFAQQYPQAYSASVTGDQLMADAHQRWQNSMNAFQQTMTVQAQVATNVQADTGTLSTLVNTSQGAVGSLQAQQATNQLLALSIKQQLQIQSLMAAQYRAQALEAARNAESDEQARTAFQKFIGNGHAYTPPQ